MGRRLHGDYSVSLGRRVRLLHEQAHEDLVDVGRLYHVLPPSSFDLEPHRIVEAYRSRVRREDPEMNLLDPFFPPSPVDCILQKGFSDAAVTVPLDRKSTRL